MKKILYVADEGIGNTVMATPVVYALRELYPKAKITFGTRAASMTIPLGLADEVIDVSKEHDSYEYDVILCSAWHSYFIKRLRKYQCKYFDKVEFKAPPTKHESEINMELVRKLGYNGKTPPTYCHVKKPKMLEIEKNVFNIAFVNGCIGSPWERKEWTRDIEFLDYLLNVSKETRIEIYVYILGGSREARRWFGKVHSNSVKNLCGLMNIDECAWVIRECNVTVANDTGLMHVAAAIDAHLIALWGSTSLTKNKPLGRNVTILKNDELDCLECWYTPRRDRCKDFKCMKTITPEMVFDRILRTTDKS